VASSQPEGPCVVAGRGPLDDAATRRLGDQVRELLLSGAGPVVTLDLTGLEGPDLGTVHGLARLQLSARRQGGSVRVRAGRHVRQLLALAGLSEVLPCSVVEPRGQPESREQRRVQEVVHVDDAPG